MIHVLKFPGTPFEAVVQQGGRGKWGAPRGADTFCSHLKTRF